MPRFYFHVHNDLDTEDEEGQDLPDLAAVRHESIEAIRDIAVESVRKGNLDLNHRIRVTDEAGEDVMTVLFREAIDVKG